MERIRRLFVVLVWLAYGVTAFRLFGNFLDHPRRDENASLISFGLIILFVTILAAFLHKGVNWIMMMGKKPQKGLGSLPEGDECRVKLNSLTLFQ